MRALVTGGAGFIGSALVERLVAEGHSVDVVDDLSTGALSNLADARGDHTGELRIHQADVRLPEIVTLVARRAPEVVFHLAARPDLTAPVEDAEVHLVAALRVMAAARAAGAKMVVPVDGSAFYGDVESGHHPVRESEAPSPRAPLGLSGVALLAQLRLARESGLEFTMLALASVYGPRDRDGLVGQIASAVLDGVAAPAPTGELDLLYVDDAVDALVRSASKGGGLLCNVGTGVATSAATVLGVAAVQAGRPDAGRGPTTAAPAVAGVRLDPGRARIHLGWSPFTPLEDGLAATLRWWSTHP